MKRKLLTLTSLFILSSALYAQNIHIQNGWQLLGATEDINVSKFNNSCVDYIWKYDNNSWQLHIANGQSYNYTGSQITSLNQGDGFWIKGNNTNDCDINVEPITLGNWYKPDINTSWQWQLQGDINTSYSVELYDIDLFDSNKSLIQSLQNNNKKVICYFSAGSYENWRDDKNNFPQSALGSDMDGWEGEKWLDISNKDLEPIMISRLDLAKEKGCDGVEPDNMDGYTNDTGFSLSSDEQLAYNKFIANEAHKRGLSVGLKNDLDQIMELEPYYDFSVNEQCHIYNECDKMEPFIDANKPVFNAEYNQKYVDNNNSERDNMCSNTISLQFKTLVLPLDLDDSFRYSCESNDTMGYSTSNNVTLHKNVSVTFFWIGEEGNEDNNDIPNIQSAWDDNWKLHYGGIDDPKNRAEYLPANFTPNENPFYFALPYNDFNDNGERKESSFDIVPWAKEKQWNTTESMCKNRWLKITKGGKSAYAQWEDVGPFGEDDAQYVFGNSLPKNEINNYAGLDVSPAVKDYLELSDIDKVDWQFINFDQVPDGPWKDVVTTSQIDWGDSSSN